MRKTPQQYIQKLKDRLNDVLEGASTGGIREPISGGKKSWNVIDSGWFVGLVEKNRGERPWRFETVGGFPPDGRFETKRDACEAAHSEAMQRRLHILTQGEDIKYHGQYPENLLIFYFDSKIKRRTVEFTADNCEIDHKGVKDQ